MIEPIPMILFCPRCGVQHIDAPDSEPSAHMDGHETMWTNPPHRSHLCTACGCIWRPADVATTGVEAIATRGSADNFDASKPRVAMRDHDAFYAHLRGIPEGKWLQLGGRVRRDRGVISLTALTVTHG